MISVNDPILYLSPCSAGAPPSPLTNYSSSSSLDSPVENVSFLESLKMKRVASSSALSSIAGHSYNTNIFTNVWKTLLQMVTDPCKNVALMARELVNTIKLKVRWCDHYVHYKIIVMIIMMMMMRIIIIIIIRILLLMIMIMMIIII